MSIEAVTPQQLIYLYGLLPDEGKAVFRDLLGKRLTAEQFYLVMGALPDAVKARVMSMSDRSFTTVAVPSLVLEAIRPCAAISRGERAGTGQDG